MADRRKYRDLDAFFLANEDRTHEWLAEQLGVDRSYISLLRSKQRVPSLPMALRIEEITGVPVQRLVAA
jgi:plasmid maintenance system antidote protein VapI